MITKTEFSNCPDFLQFACMGRKFYTHISTNYKEELLIFLLRSNLSLLNSLKFVFSAITLFSRFHTEFNFDQIQVNAVVLFKGINA